MNYFWLSLMIFLLFLEAITFNLFTIWFALGALGAFIISYFVLDMSVQVIVFSIISIVSLLSTRSLVKKYLNTKKVKTNLDAVVGKVGLVNKRITPNEFGIVKVDGKEWTAKSSHLIDIGEEIEVLAIEGVKLIVKRKED